MPCACPRIGSKPLARCQTAVPRHRMHHCVAGWGLLAAKSWPSVLQRELGSCAYRGLDQQLTQLHQWAIPLFFPTEPLAILTAMVRRTSKKCDAAKKVTANIAVRYIRSLRMRAMPSRRADRLLPRQMDNALGVSQFQRAAMELASCSNYPTDGRPTLTYANPAFAISSGR